MGEKVFVVRNCHNRTMFIRETDFVEKGVIFYLDEFLNEMQLNERKHIFHYYNFWDYGCLYEIDQVLWKHMDDLMWDYYRRFTQAKRQEMFDYIFAHGSLEANYI